MSKLPVTAAHALAAFKHYLGIGEHPPGSNRNGITKWFGMVGPWCAMTISKVLDDCGVLKAVLGRAMAYTVDIYLRGKAQGWLVSTGKHYEPGDIVLYNFGDPHYGGRPLGIHHVGMVVADIGGGRFVSYEGNTGNDARRRVRSKSGVAAVVRPPWAKPAKAKPKPKKRPLLQLGSKGDAVEKVQRYIIRKSYSCGDAGADGVFGRRTQAAVRRYQTKRLPRSIRGVAQWDGIVGPRTWALIDAGK